MQTTAEMLFYGAIFSIIFLIAFSGVMLFDKQSRAEFLQEVSGS